jgi:hypothetical protein
MAYIWQKIGMMVAILVSSVVMGFAPLGLKKVDPARKMRLLSYGNVFAGGVFFAIGYVSFFPPHLPHPIQYSITTRLTFGHNIRVFPSFMNERIILPSSSTSPHSVLDYYTSYFRAQHSSFSFIHE